MTERSRICRGGSGLKSTDSILIVIPDKKFESDFMKFSFLGKGKGFSHESSQALSQGIIPPFNVVGLPALFAHGGMGFFGKNRRVGIPEIAKRPASFVRVGNAFPEFFRTLLTSRTNDVGHHLASSTT